MPTMLNEIQLGQLMAIEEKGTIDALETISLLSGIAIEELTNVSDPDDLLIFSEHLRSLAHQVKYLYESDILPHRVTFLLGKRKVTINVIRNLSIEPAGAFLTASDIIADEINAHINLYGEDNWESHFQPSLKACCDLLSQYFFCRATGKRYDEYDAYEFREIVKKLMVTEALPIARHFFSCYPDLLKQKIGFFQRLHQYWRRRKVIKRLKNIKH